MVLVFIALVRALLRTAGTLAVAACLLAHAAQAREPDATLPATVNAALQRTAIPLSHAAVLVTELDTGRPLVAVNVDRPMNPASVMKLVTTYIALDTLGADYRWSTPVYAVGPTRNGTLDGTLYVKGSGDPALTFQRLREFVMRMRRAGLKEIRGDIVLDRSHFRLPQADLERFLGEIENPFNVPPDALLLNLKAVRLSLLPDARTQTVRVVAEPHPAQLKLEGGVGWGDWGCDGWRKDVSVHVVSTEESAHVRVGGRYPGRCGQQVLDVSLLGHQHFFYGAFRALWAQSDGSHAGQLREGKVPRGARLVDTWQSPPLAEIVGDINKHSNNLMARQLFLELGAPAHDEVATLERSRAAMHRWLADRGFDASALVLDNGSGLSWGERASARVLERLLNAAAKSEVAGPLLRSLAVMGVDGTVQGRLAGTPVAGNALMKTGTLPEVRSIAGYVQSKSGRWHVVVMMVNGAQAAQSLPAIDALVGWVYER